MTELLPCPFCGGEAHTIEPARYGKSWGVRCECGAFLGFEHTEAEAIAAWNTRAERETINKTDDFVTHDNRATGGTLTAEQVRKAIFNGSSYASYDGAQYYANGIDMQAIADELNSRAERTCRVNELDSLTQTLSIANGCQWGECSTCGCLTPIDSVFCVECGAKVVGE